MARPRHVRPTPAELEILQTLWEYGPLTVRETLERLASKSPAVDGGETGEGSPRAYTSVMSLMNVMAEKGQLTRSLDGRAYRYSPAAEPARIRGDFLRDVWKRVFGGSTEGLALQLLDVSSPTEEELEAIRTAIDAYRDDKLRASETNDSQGQSSPRRRS